MAKPRINSGDFTGLKDKGVSSATIEKLKNAVSLGARLTNRADIIKAGIPAEEADAVAANASLSTAETAKPVTVTIRVTPKELVGYSLGIRREIAESTDEDEVLLPVLSSGVEYTYDDATTGATFTLFVKAPGGELATSSLEGSKGTLHIVKKPVLGTKPIDVEPVGLITNAKAVAATAEPLLPPSRLKGRLISGNPDISTEERQIVIEVALKDNPADTDFFPVCFAKTESEGYFFTSQLVFPTPSDFRNLTAARARVALAPTILIPIRLDPVTRGKFKLPERVILYFDRESAEGADADGDDHDCSCGDCSDLDFHEKKVLDEFSYYTVVRTTEPLIETYEISDVEEIDLDDLLDDVDGDVRGALSGLKVNRDLVATFLTRNKTINKGNIDSFLDNIRADKLRRRVLTLPTPRKGRVFLDIDNDVDWDEKPTVYQAVSIAHGHLLHFKQEWFHDGYSMGDLLYSLPLAPGQKKQIVVFDWDRKESAANVQQLDYQESLYNSLSRDRDVNEVARATLNETTTGFSTAMAAGGGGGFGIGAIIPIQVPIGALLGVGGGMGVGSSFARNTGSRTTTASSQQQISDRTVQAANAVRSQRSTVIQTVSQGERFEVSAESIANYNHCHAMTIQYFEVLRHFEIRTRLADVQECLFIPLKMSPFTPKKALRWRDILTRCLTKRNLVPGFDALHRIEEERESSTENYYDSIGLPRDRFAEEELEYVEGELYMEFQITRPRNDDADEFLEAAWGLWLPFIGNAREFYDRFIRKERERDDAFARHAGPRIASAIFELLKFEAVKNGPAMSVRKLPIDATLMSDFRNRAKLNVSLRMSAPVGPVKREDIDFVRISIDDTSNQTDLVKALVNDRAIRMIVHSGNMRYRTRNLHEYLFQSSSIRNDLTPNGDDVRIFCPLSAKALRRPRLEDVEVSNDLLHHLNENIEYYHQCIWSRMDAQRRFMLLDGALAPGRGAGRSVASVVENKLIGIVGNCLVMPVAPGFKLDPVLDEKVDLFEHYYEEPLDPSHLSLPTKGVFAEAVMGQCNSCEKKEESRFWRWDESPIPDSPTDINAITVPTPQPSQPNLVAKDFPSPIISLQNGPTLPDPTGITALTTLLSKPDLFRDLSGLSENQKNALGALKASLETAQKFGEGAAELTQAAAAMKLIQDARKQGALPNEKADELAAKTAETAVPKSDKEKLDLLDDLLNRLKKWYDDGKIPEDVKNDKAADAVDNTVQDTTAPPPSKQKAKSKPSKPKGKKKYNLTLRFEDAGGLPIEGSFVLNYGSLINEVFDIDNSTSVKEFEVELDPSRMNTLKIRGNPYIMNTSAPLTTEFYYYFRDAPTTVGTNKNLTFTVLRTREIITSSSEKSKSESTAIEEGLTRQLTITSTPSAEIDLVVAKIGGEVSIEGSRAWTDSKTTDTGTTETEMTERKLKVPARKLKIDQYGIDDPEMDVEE